MKAQLIIKPTLHIRCWKHRCPAIMTIWKPTQGLDIGMRKYRCLLGGEEHYLVFNDLVELEKFEEKWAREFLID